MIHRFLLCVFLFSLVVPLVASAQPEQLNSRWRRRKLELGLRVG